MAKPKPQAESLPKAPPVRPEPAGSAPAKGRPGRRGPARTGPKPGAGVAAAVPAAVAVEPPRTVRYAVWCMYAGAVLAVVDLIATLATVGGAKTALHNAHPAWSATRLTSTVHDEIAYLIVTWIITLGLWIVMARTNLAGRGWARIAASVLCVLSTLSFVSFIVQPSSLASKLVLIPMWLVGVAAITFLWQRTTSAYIRAGKEL